MQIYCKILITPNIWMKLTSLSGNDKGLYATMNRWRIDPWLFGDICNLHLRFQQLYLLCRQPRHIHDRCIRSFFSLPTQEFFRGQGKIKVGTGMDNFKNITCRKSTRPNDALHWGLIKRFVIVCYFNGAIMPPKKYQNSTVLLPSSSVWICTLVTSSGRRSSISSGHSRKHKFPP